MLSRLAVISIVFLFLYFPDTLATAVEESPSKKQSTLTVVRQFDDDLTTAGRSKYETDGSLEWDKNKPLKLNASGAVKLNVRTGPRFRMEADVKHRSNSYCNRIELYLQNQTQYLVTILCRESEFVEISFAFVGLGGAKTSGKPIRKTKLPIRNFDTTKVNIEMNWGMLSINGNAAYRDRETTNIIGVRVEQIEGETEFSRIAVDAIPAIDLPAGLQKQADQANALEKNFASHLGKREFREALDTGTKLWRLRADTLGAHHLDTLRAKANLVVPMLQLKKRDESQLLLQSVLEQSESVVGPMHPLKENLLRLKALAAANKSVTNDFVDLHSRAFEIQKSYSDSDDPAYRKRLQQLANLYFGTKDFEKSIPLYREQAAIIQRHRGAQSAQYAAALSYLGASYRGLGNLDEAESSLKQALVIYQKSLGIRHRIVAQAASNVAAVCTDRGNYQEALTYGQQAFQVVKTIHKPKSREYTKTLVDLLVLYQEVGENENALGISEQAIQLAREVYGENNQEYLRAVRATAKTYSNHEMPVQAIPYFEIVVQLSKQTFGAKHVDYAKYLVELANCQMKLAKFSSAEQNFQTAIKIFESQQKTDHRSYTNAILALADMQITKARYRNAADLLRTTLSTLEQHSKKNTHDYALSLRRHAKALDQMGRTKQAHAEYLESLQIAEQVEGKESLLYANCLDRLGQHFELNGEYAAAIDKFQQALSIKKQLVGNENLSFLATQNNLAFLHATLGNYKIAESLYLEAIRHAQPISIARSNPLLLVIKTSNLGNLYLQIGRYNEAEATLHTSLKLSESSFGKDHPIYARQLGSFAALKMEIGDYPASLQLLKTAQSILANSLGKLHPEYAKAIFNLAIVSGLSGMADQKETLLREAIRIVETIYDDQHPDCILYSNELASFYYAKGDFVRAEEIIVANRQPIETIYGNQHPRFADNLFDLGVLKFDVGELKSANTLFQQAAEIFEKSFGSQHPRFIATKQEQFKIAIQQGNVSHAQTLAKQVTTGMLQASEAVLPVLSDAESRSWLQRNHPPIGMLLASQRQSKSLSDEAIYEFVWRYRGISTRMHANRNPSLHESDEVQNIRSQLALVRHRLAYFYQATRSFNAVDSTHKQIERLTAQKEELEKRLARTSPQSEKSFAYRNSTPEMLAELIPHNVAVVDFVCTEYFFSSKATDPKRQPESADLGRPNSEYRYDAFVLSRDAGSEYKLNWVPLSASNSIDAAIEQWLRFFREGKGDGRDSARLRKLVWNPLADKLAGKKQVILIPDGRLAVLPWAALPGTNATKYLLEEIGISLAPTGHELIRSIRGQQSDIARMTLVGGIDYDHRSEKSSTATASADPTIAFRQLRSGRKNRWKPLPFAEQEINDISKIWSQQQTTNPNVITGADVGESILAHHLRFASHAHIATHGFYVFENDSFHNHDATESAMLVRTHDRNPFLRSGLVLSGANSPKEADDRFPGDDGILLAEEVASLDLSKIQLVVLSSCESGLGALIGSDGAFGLQRAFHQAGAKTTIASLWQVDDRVTRHLMARFYENLLQKQMRPEKALRQAQLWILNHGSELGELRGPGAITKAPIKSTSRTSPRFWAPWILSGDPGIAQFSKK